MENIIRTIRKEYKISQGELSESVLTRPYLSKIENNKTPITIQNAVLIAQQLNKISKDKGIEFYFEKEDIINPSRYFEKKKVQNELNELMNSSISEDDVFYIKRKYFILDMPFEYAKLHMIIGDYHLDQNEPKKMIMHYAKAFDTLSTLGITLYRAKLLDLIISGYVLLQDFENALFFDMYLDDMLTHESIDPYWYENLLFHSAQLHKKVGNFEKSLQRIDKIVKAEGVNEPSQVRFITLKASILLKLGQLKEAEALQKSIMSSTISPSQRFLSLINIGNIAIIKGDEDETLRRTLEELNTLVESDIFSVDVTAQFWVDLLDLSILADDTIRVRKILGKVHAACIKSNNLDAIKNYAALLLGREAEFPTEVVYPQLLQKLL